MRGLYVHIPFCVRKCSYCDFYSLPERLESLDNYIEAVLTEARQYRGLDFQTIYLGGGTPSLLGPDGLSRLMGGLHRLFDLSNVSEATMEANPESVSPELMETALETGINRLSIGVQSLSDVELAGVGRIHTAAQAMLAIDQAMRSGFENISADLILGLPGQDWQSLKVNLETLTGKGLPHLSVYCLSVEPGTPLATYLPMELASDDEQADLYQGTVELLNRRGLEHYEISNFAVPGKECQHNLNYWRGGEYIGLGPAGASHIEGRRFSNKADLDAYIQNPTGQIEEVEVLSQPNKAAEEAILRLRLLKEGLDTSELADRYGDENVIGLVSRLNALVREGSLLRNGAVYRLRPERVLTSNAVLARVLGD